MMGTAGGMRRLPWVMFRIIDRWVPSTVRWGTPSSRVDSTVTRPSPNPWVRAIIFLPNSSTHIWRSSGTFRRKSLIQRLISLSFQGLVIPAIINISTPCGCGRAFNSVKKRLPGSKSILASPAPSRIPPSQFAWPFVKRAS